ncbi:MAG: hypothetical protein EOP54_27805, partial [Sphingobacteriales bacterium]
MKPVTQPQKYLLLRMDAHYKVYIALLVGVAAFFATRHMQSTPAVAMVVWIAVALSIIVLDWIAILKAHPRDIRKLASLE